MTGVIWKYPIALHEEQVQRMPVGAQILSVQMQRSQPCLWVLVNPNSPREERTIYVHGTGHEADFSNKRFIGTIQFESEQLVFHVFEKAKIQ